MVILLVCSFFFFFFQAEDGIRDVAVTGVQTCALPIYRTTADPNLRALAATAFERLRGVPPSPQASAVISLGGGRSEEHTSELQSRLHLVCRLLLEKKKNETRPQHMSRT